jgi:hypothetical protein
MRHCCRVGTFAIEVPHTAFADEFHRNSLSISCVDFASFTTVISIFPASLGRDVISFDSFVSRYLKAVPGAHLLPQKRM